MFDESSANRTLTSWCRRDEHTLCPKWEDDMVACDCDCHNDPDPYRSVFSQQTKHIIVTPEKDDHEQ
jgi:hypothetical protein